ncbi:MULTISPECIES: hypothetical protein [Pseudoalteromonas]|uniref:DUF4019 domain-containing protein n=1 Tax=Pseudoalteromonas rubra TaxID=43658 RepID=A0A5S3UTZ4_9GAMM|nr:MULTISPECIES: hypothetical protein [Pseudoalteromonas]MCG7563723.1 hypothetical protein [Pseudoalteromonas sp. McH1-42]QPB82374.1 hypothetical protein CWC22_004985 [Pseudoalteromonas rubra]
MKVLKVLGIGISSIFVFFIGIAIITGLNKADPDETFIPFLEQQMPQVTNWDLDFIQSLMIEQAVSSATPEQWQMYIEKISTLGKLEHIEGIQLENMNTRTSFTGNTTTTAVYLLSLQFSTGPAHARLILLHTEEGGVKIQHLKFLADRLMQ